MNLIKKILAVKTVYSDNKTFLIFSVGKREGINYSQIQMFETDAYREYLLPFQCTKTSKSNKISFDVSGLTSLSEYLKTEMKQEQYFEIISGIQNVISFCRDSHLSCDNLVFDLEYMYFHNAFKRILMIYMPLNNTRYIRDSIPECLANIHKSAKNVVITDGSLMSRYECFLERFAGNGRKRAVSFSIDSFLQILDRESDLTSMETVEFISENEKNCDEVGLFISGQTKKDIAAGNYIPGVSMSLSVPEVYEVYLTNSSGKRFDIKKFPFSIGRNISSDLVIEHATVSGKHAVITEENGHYFIRDHSSNGTYLNSEENRITCSEINDGDRIFFDQFCYIFTLRKNAVEESGTRTVIVSNRNVTDSHAEESNVEISANFEKAIAYLKKMSDNSLIKIMDYPFTSPQVDGVVIYTLNSSGKKGIFIKNVSCRSLLFENIPIETGFSEELFSGCSLQIYDEKYMFIVEN